VETDGHQHEPEQSVPLQDMVMERQLLGLAPIAGVQHPEDVQDGQDQGEDGELDPDHVAAGMSEKPSTVERPQAV
jgi:hypothetical protein